MEYNIAVYNTLNSTQKALADLVKNEIEAFDSLPLEDKRDFHFSRVVVDVASLASKLHAEEEDLKSKLVGMFIAVTDPAAILPEFVLQVIKD